MITTHRGTEAVRKVLVASDPRSLCASPFDWRSGRPERSRGAVCRIVWLSLLLCVAASASADAQQLLDRVIARVNGVPITLTDVTAAIGLGLIEVPASGDSQTAAMVQLIDRQLMLAEVARFAPPEPDGVAVDREAARLRMRAGARLDELMRTTGVDEVRIHDIARDTLRIQAYLDQRFGTSVQVSDEEVEQYYRAHPEEFLRNGRLMSFEDAEPLARMRASAARRAASIAQWLRDLRARAEIGTPSRRS
jgi:hypothetical protein